MYSLLKIVASEFISCRYLVDQRWLKQWKKCSSFDTLDQIDVESEAENPGPVDNCNLFKGMMYNKFSFKPAIFVAVGKAGVINITIAIWNQTL